MVRRNHIQRRRRRSAPRHYGQVSFETGKPEEQRVSETNADFVIDAFLTTTINLRVYVIELPGGRRLGM